MTTPSVSVLITTVRFDADFEAAVRSVLDDVSNGLDLEVVVVSDGVEEAAPQWLVAEPRVVLVALHVRHGTPRALNRGLTVASAPYVARLDADDISMPGRLVRQSTYLADHGEVAVVASTARIIDATGRVLGAFGKQASAREVRDTLWRRNPLIHSSVMYRRGTVLDELGGYDVECQRMQDYELFLRVAVAGHAIVILDDPLVAYRVHARQSSRNSPPSGPGFRSILRGRRRLASDQGVGPVRVLASQAIWVAAQHARHLGWRRPRYMRGTPR
jgi:glycosyltransferase involved in cell wall biosynthesis